MIISRLNCSPEHGIVYFFPEATIPCCPYTSSFCPFICLWIFFCFHVLAIVIGEAHFLISQFCQISFQFTEVTSILIVFPLLHICTNIFFCRSFHFCFGRCSWSCITIILIPISQLLPRSVICGRNSNCRFMFSFPLYLGTWKNALCSLNFYPLWVKRLKRTVNIISSNFGQIYVWFRASSGRQQPLHVDALLLRKTLY